ncbi:hypothetical protein BLSTO_06533, partial [Blastocystis sp. subtype 1]
RSHSRHSHNHSRRSHSRRRSSRSRSQSRSHTSHCRTKNTLFDKNKSIPNFDLIEPRYAYGKDLYVGNLEEGSYPEDIVAFLNRAMRTANLNIWPGNPVLSCRILPKFCFVSLRHEDEASAALNLDGIFFHGQRLKISQCSMAA